MWLPRLSARSVIQTAGVIAVSAIAMNVHVTFAIAEDLETIEFALKDVRYLIEVPRSSRVDSTRRAGCTVIWHPRAIRLMKFIEFCPMTEADRPRRRHQLRLTEDIRVGYDVDRGLDGGSGGSEAELRGELEISGSVVRLTCHDQSEWGPDPEWCLPHLRSVRPQRK